MAKAIMSRVAGVDQISGAQFSVKLEVNYLGGDVPTGFQQDFIDVILNGTESIQQIRQAFTDAAVQRATENGYTLAATALYLFSFDKGA